MTKHICPQCGSGPYATYYEKQYGVAPGVAVHRGWPLGNQWAICLFGHRWVIVREWEMDLEAVR